MIRHAAAVFLLTLFIGCISFSSSASAGSRYRVKGVDIYLALRTGMAYDARNEIGKIYNGQEVEFISVGDSTYWYVYAPTLGKYGYVNKNYLTAVDDQSDSKTYTVQGVDLYLALRNAMAYDARNEIGKIYNGQTVEYISTGDSTYWFVYAPSLGRYGYVNKNYLVKTSSGSVVSGTWYSITDRYKDGIALHPIPDPNSSVLTRLPYGTQFYVTYYSGNYGYTTWNGFTGWINLKYAKKSEYSDNTVDSVDVYVEDISGGYSDEPSGELSMEEAEAAVYAYLDSQYDMDTVYQYHGYVISLGTEGTEYVFRFKSYNGALTNFYVDMDNGNIFLEEINPITNEAEPIEYVGDVYSILDGGYY